MENEAPPAETKPRHLWPWVLAAVLGLGVLLAVVWVRAEARRIHQQRQTHMLPSGGAVYEGTTHLPPPLAVG